MGNQENNISEFEENNIREFEKSMVELLTEQSKTNEMMNNLPEDYSSDMQTLFDANDAANYTVALQKDICKEIDECNALASDILKDLQSIFDFSSNEEEENLSSEDVLQSLIDVFNFDDDNILSDERVEEIQNLSVQNVLDKSNMDQQVAEDLAKAFNASYNAQHPIKFAFAQLIDAIKTIVEIPKQMAENVRIANAAGLDSQHALQKASKTIAVQVGKIYDNTKKTIVSNATEVAKNACNIFGMAVDGLQTTWNKAKEGFFKALKAVGKGFDIGLEAITLGGWSRLCDRMYKDGQHAGVEHQYSHRVEEKLEKLGYEKDNKLFGQEERKNGVLLDKFNDNLSKAMYSLHCKLSGDSLNETSHQEYWREIKESLWGKDENAREEVFGCTSPMDSLVNGVEAIDKKFAQIDRDFTKSVDKMAENAKEKAEVVAKFIKDIPRNTKKCGEKAVVAMGAFAKEAGEQAIETFTKARVGSLRQFAKIVDKVAIAEKSAERRNRSNQMILGEARVNTHNKITELETELASITGQKVVADYQLPKELESFKAELSAAKSPTTEIQKALSSIEKMERSGMRNAEVKATTKNVANLVKNSGRIAYDKVKIEELKYAEKNAEKEFDKAKKKTELHKSIADKSDSFANNLRNKADQLEKSMENKDDMEHENDGDERA